jgi:fibrillarin-like rRNA methylase
MKKIPNSNKKEEIVTIKAKNIKLGDTLVETHEGEYRQLWALRYKVTYCQVDKNSGMALLDCKILEKGAGTTVSHYSFPINQRVKKVVTLKDILNKL